MNKIKIILPLFLLLMLISSCNQFEDLFKSTGPITTEERHLPFIDNIEMNNNVDLVIHIDSVFRMTVTAGSNLIEKIETNIEGNKLIIKNKNKFNWVRSFNPTLIVDVWVPTLANIKTYNSSGNVTCVDTLRSPLFQFDSFGSIGHYELLLNCSTTHLELHNGPADILVSGVCNYSYIYNASDGVFNGENYITTQTDIVDGGVNDVKVMVNNLFNVNLQSSGNIYYKGKPTTLNKEITGTGKLIPL